MIAISFNEEEKDSMSFYYLLHFEEASVNMWVFTDDEKIFV